MYRSFKQFYPQQNKIKTQTLQTKMQLNIIITCVNNNNSQNEKVHTNKN
jgi:hypothetical protein